MYKVLEYLKYIGIFFIFIVVIAIFTSLINLTGINSVLVSKLGVILTALSFFIVASRISADTKEKGFIVGVKLGLFCILLLVVINLIFFKSNFKIDRILYYIILLASSALGGSFGKNFKLKIFHKKK